MTVQGLPQLVVKAIEKAAQGFYESRFAIKWGMWKKGEAIVNFRGVNLTTSFLEMERITGRTRQSLKKWNDLYEKYPNEEIYKPIAEKEAREWTDKTIKKLLGQTEPPKQIPELPQGKYRIIYADPPWQYSDKLIEGYGAAEHHYPTMDIEKLCELPIKDLASENAVLFLWTTSPILDECWPVVEAWGFEYKSSFIWDKEEHNYGHYNSVRHEFLLICTRGSCLPESDELFDSVQTIKRSEVHSQKPERFREIIDTLYPYREDSRVDRIELFARTKVKNWDAWGDEIITKTEKEI